MQSEQVSKSQFKAKARKFLRRVEVTAESVVITDKGHPTVEVRRFLSDRRTPIERLRGDVVQYESPREPVGESDWEVLS